jgi:hypothetical protein
MKLASRACNTQIVVVRAPAEPVSLWCGGTPMALPGKEGDAVEVAQGFTGGSQLGWTRS